MRRRWQIAAVAGGGLAVGALALVFRVLSTAGVFTEVTPGFAGTCQTIPGIVGGEDIAVDRRAGLAIISATDRRPQHPARARDGLYAMSIAHPEAGVTRLSGTPADFHPLGISLYRGPEGALTLMAVNRRLEGDPSIDIFSLTLGEAGGRMQVKLHQGASIRSPLFFSPNDVAATGPERFYVSNDHTSRTSLGRFLETYLLLPRANIVYYDSRSARVAAEGLRYANGLALSADGTRLYAAESLGRDIRSYDIARATGDLSEAGDYALPAGLDNIDRDASGNLWVAGHPKLFAFAHYASHPDAPSPSEIFRVTMKNGLPDGFTRVYSGPGTRIGAASVAVSAGGQMLVGSVFDDKILDCAPR